MAANAAAVWECRASGVGVSDNNGGAWAPLNVSTFSGTNLVVDGSVNTTVTSVTHNFAAADVGCRLLITAATGSGWIPGMYTINSVAANAALLSSSPAAVGTTGGTWAMVGIDYANQLAPQVAIGGGVVTTSITTSVITFTGGTYTPSQKDIGNHVQMISGTNVTANSFFHVTAVSATTWTMDANVVSAGTTTNGIGNMGGALLTLGTLAAKAVASNKLFVTGAFGSIAGVTFAQTVASPTNTTPQTRLVGYGSVRGDTGHATMTLGSGTVGINCSGAGFSVEQIDVNCNSVATSTGISITGGVSGIERCFVTAFTTAGITAAGASTSVTECEVGNGAGTAAINCTSTTAFVQRNYVHDNTCIGIKTLSLATVIDNLVTNNIGATTDGINISHDCVVNGNTVHGSGRHGITASNNTAANNNFRGNLLTNNTGFGFTDTSGSVQAAAACDGNAYFSNNGGVGNLQRSVAVDFAGGIFGVNPYVNVRDVILTVSPYVGGTTGSTANFALNNTAGGGAACRGTGSPSTWPGNTGTTSYLDLGAVQTRGSNTSPSAGGSPGIVMAV